MTRHVEIEKVERDKVFVDLALTMGEFQAMDACTRMSVQLWKGSVQGKLACIWGLIPPTMLSNRAYIWLWTSDIEGHPFLLVRYSQIVIQKMLEQYELVVGHCIVGNDKAIKWLKWLGAEFGKPQGKKVPFMIRRK